MLSLKKLRSLSSKNQKGQVLIMVIIIIVAIGSIMLVGGFTLPETEPTGQPFTPNITPVSADPQRQNLQLQTLTFSEPSYGCNHDNGKPTDRNCECSAYSIECRAGECVRTFKSVFGTEDMECADSPMKTTFDAWCQAPGLTGGLDGFFCLGKPVIYLYPTKPTFVDVSIETPGRIVVSDPLYPAGGWKNVLSEPNGTLTYEGEQYRELFYESEVSNFLKPKNGVIIATSELRTKLKKLVYELGLNEFESEEFLDFWVPRLENLNSNYILFSVIEKSAKEKIDHVNINPEPDTRIEFIGYFKPISTPLAVEPLKLPARPERRGFTSVEWGATIDNNGTPVLK